MIKMDKYWYIWYQIKAKILVIRNHFFLSGLGAGCSNLDPFFPSIYHICKVSVLD